MALITSVAGGGNWATGATWVGGVAPADNVDNVDLKGPVTIPAGTTVSIGDWTTDAVKLSATAAKLIVQGQLVSKGHINIANSSAEVKIESTTEAPTVTLSCTSGFTSQIKGTGTCNATSKLTVIGTSTYWATITSTAGTGLPGQIEGSFAYTLNLQYLILDSLGSAAGTVASKCFNVVRNITCDHVLVKFCGQLEILLSLATTHVDINHMDIRTPRDATYAIFITASAANPTGVRHIRNSSFSGIHSVKCYFNVLNLLVDTCVYWCLYPQYPQPNTIQRNCLHVGPTGINNADSTGMLPTPNSNFLMEESGWFHYTDTMVGGNTNVGHELKETAASLGLARNICRNIVIEAGGNNDGTGNRSGGDWLLPGGAWLLDRILAVNGYGNISDGLFNSPVIEMQRCTQVNASWVNGGGTGGLVIAEGIAQTTMVGNVRNNIFYGNVSGICQGGSSFRRQDNFALANNCSYGLISGGSGGGFLLNAAGVQTYLERPHSTTLVSLTPLTGSTAIKLIATGNTLGVLTGDYAKSAGVVFAIVTAVAENVDGANTTTLTLGINLQGTQGATGLAVGVAVSIHRGYWSAGTIYGNSGQGANDLLNTNPQFVALRTIAGYDLSVGGPGTAANFGLETLKLNGWDVNGASATFNTAYAVAPPLAYIRAGYTPTNEALRAAGAVADGSPDIGAVAMAAFVPPASGNGPLRRLSPGTPGGRVTGETTGSLARISGSQGSPTIVGTPGTADRTTDGTQGSPVTGRQP